jgi:hypothetical protein
MTFGVARHSLQPTHAQRRLAQIGIGLSSAGREEQQVHDVAVGRGRALCPTGS